MAFLKKTLKQGTLFLLPKNCSSLNILSHKAKQSLCVFLVPLVSTFKNLTCQKYFHWISDQSSHFDCNWSLEFELFSNEIVRLSVYFSASGTRKNMKRRFVGQTYKALFLKGWMTEKLWFDFRQEQMHFIFSKTGPVAYLFYTNRGLSLLAEREADHSAPCGKGIYGW